MAHVLIQDSTSMFCLSLIVLLLSVCSYETEHQAKYKNRPEDANLIHPDYVLYQSPSRSLTDCAAQCLATLCCVRVSYTQSSSSTRDTMGMCRGHFVLLLNSSEGTNTPLTITLVRADFKEVSGTVQNAALNKTATQSSLYVSHYAYLAADGNVASHGNKCAHTEGDFELSWWQVDLGSVFRIKNVIITNRGDCCGERLKNFDILVYTEDPSTNIAACATLCHHYDGPVGQGVTQAFPCSHGPATGRFVRVKLASNGSLTLCEVQVMAVPAL